MKQGGFVGGEMIMLMCLIGFGIYGIVKYTTAENNDYKKQVKLCKDIMGDVTQLRRDLKKNTNAIGEIQLNWASYRKLAEELGKDVDQVQDHLHRTRDDVQNLKYSNSPKAIKLDLSTNSPIPITILDKTPVKKKRIVRRKTGTNRVETRVSPLKGDPDKVPVRKKKAVKKKVVKKKTVRKSSKRSKIK